VRYFLLDRVTEVVPGELARGTKCVTLTDEALHDHFPDHPIFPGALLVEAMAQLGGFLLEVSENADEKPLVRALLGQIRRAKFEHPAEPGDRIDLEVRLARALDTAAEVHAEAHVDGRRIAQADLTFVLRQVGNERVHEARRALYRMWTKRLGHEVRIP
jgi:3-hydroxymyristoyl/3-hydroxydecanoyl-(acyl carrier protein) dehydratase